jgi:hypothetical protein
MIQKMEDDAPYELYQRAWGGKKEDEDITPAFVLARAKEIIEDFNECGHDLHEKLAGSRGEKEQKFAGKLKMEVEQFIKKYGIVPASPIQLMKKDAPYELKERVIERVRSCEKLSPKFVLLQAKEMIVEFYKKGNNSYEDISGDNGEEAQNMANELKASLEEFVKKYEGDFKTANLLSLSHEETLEITPKGEKGEELKEEKAPPEKLSLFVATLKEATSNATLLPSKTQQYHISP